MAQKRRGCAVLFILLLAGLGVGGWYGWKWYKKRLPPPPSGGELRVHVLDVGQGDAILVLGPEDAQTKQRKTVLIDTGDNLRPKALLESLKRNGITQLDWLILTHPHLDHIGGADEVIKNVKVLQVLDTDTPPPGPDIPVQPTPAPGKKNAPAPRVRISKIPELPTTKAYKEYRAALDAKGVPRAKVELGQKLDLGGNAFLTVLAPTEPLFREDQTAGSGNALNANSLVMRLDYGAFGMIFAGDAERITEERLIQKEALLTAQVLKIGHHGSKYATSERWLQAVKPSAAIMSLGINNRYGHPAQSVLDRLKAANVKPYRTDLQGEIIVTTTGQAPDKDKPVYQIKATKEAPSDALWTGRPPQKDDSDRTGFIAYGEFGPPPKEKKTPTPTSRQ